MTGQFIGRRGMIALPTDDSVWESSARLGFDVAFFDCRTRPSGAQLNEATLKAGRAGLASVAITETPTTERILGQLESGVGGLCQWMPESPEALRTFVEACFYMPAGVRGMATVRPARYGLSKPLRALIDDVGAALTVGIALTPSQFTAPHIDLLLAGLPHAVGPGTGLHFVALALEPPDYPRRSEPGSRCAEAAACAASYGLELQVWGGPPWLLGEVSVGMEALFIDQVLTAGTSALFPPEGANNA